MLTATLKPQLSAVDSMSDNFKLSMSRLAVKI